MKIENETEVGGATVFPRRKYSHVTYKTEYSQNYN